MPITAEQAETELRRRRATDELARRKTPEEPDFGMIAVRREELPGVFDYNKQLEELIGDPDTNIEDFLPLDAKYEFGRVVGMTSKPDETKEKMKNSLYYSVNFGIPPRESYNIIDEMMKTTNFIPTQAKPEERGFFGKVAESWRRGDAQVMADIGIYETAFEGRGDEEQALAALKKLQLEHALDPIEGNFLAELVYSGVEVVPGMARGYWEAIPQAFEGLAIGAGMAIAAGQVPPLTLAPEEAVTVPAGTLTGAKFGLMAGSAMFWYKQGSGSMYAAMRENDYNPELSKNIAAAAAVPYAIVEFLQVSQLTPGMRRGVLKVAQKSMLKVVANATKKYGTVWGTEVFEEVVQEIIQVGAEDMSGYLSDKLKLPEGVSGFLLERGRRVWETTKQAGKAMALLPIPGAMIDVYTGQRALVPVEKEPEVEAKPDIIREIKAPEQDAIKEVAERFDISKDKAKAILERQAELRKEKAEKPPTEAIAAPEKPVAGRKAEVAPVTGVEGKVEQSFTMFAAEHGYTDDYSLIDHSELSPSGKRSKRAETARLQRMDERFKSNREGHEAYRKAILAGEIIDPTGKVTKEGLLKQQKEAKAKEVSGRIAQIDAQIRFTRDTGQGKRGLKPTAKKRIAELEAEREQLLAPTPTEDKAEGKPLTEKRAAPIPKFVSVEKEVIPKQTKEKFTPPEVQKETKTEVPDSDSETQNAANLMEGYWRQYDERKLEIDVAATKNQEAITKALGKKHYAPESDIETSKMSQAMMLYIDLKEHLSGHQFAEKLSKLQKEIYELSKNLPANIRKIADSIIKQNREAGALAIDKEIISVARENYIAHLWEKPTRQEVLQARFRQTTARAKARTLEGGIMEGWAKGKKLRVDDVTLATQIAQSQINQAIVGREMLKLGKKWGILSHKQPEGWVRVEHPGFTMWKHAGTVEVEPKGVIKKGQWVRPADRKNLGKVESVMGDKAIVHFRNKQTGLEQTVEFPIDKLKVVRSYGKNFFITDEGNLMERLPVYAEPELGKKLNNVFSPSALYKVPGIETISRYNAQIKSTILFTSLYHHQAFLRSYAFGSRGLNPKEAYTKGRESIMNMTPEVRLLVRNGLTIGRIQDYDPRMIEGEQTIWGRALSHTKLTESARKKLVDLRKRQERFLFNKMGPALKIQAGILELKAELKRNQAELESGDITADEIAAAVANLMNNDFGGLHLGRMGRSQTAQHIFRLLALAPDWTESNIRSAVQAFAKGETGYLHRMFWGRIAIKGLGATILFNLLLSAFDDDDFADRYKKAWETGRLRWLDIDITPIHKALGGDDDKRKYFSLLGHFRDPVKFTVHPIVSAKHKGSVVSRVMMDMMIGEDWAGRKFTTLGELTGITEDGKNSGRLVKYGRGGARPIEPSQIPSYALYEVRSAMPIPIQNIIAFLGGEMDAFDAITKSAGLMTATTYPEKRKPDFGGIGK